MTHGHCVGGVSPTYRSWQITLQRVLNPNTKNHHSLVARHITVDPRWADFNVFLEEMGVRPEGLCLRRKNIHAGYSKSNCYWGPHPIPPLPTSAQAKAANLASQGTSRRPKKGRPRNPTSIMSQARKAGISVSTVYARIKEGWSKKMALTVPTRPCQQVKAILLGKEHETEAIIRGRGPSGDVVKELPRVCPASPRDRKAAAEERAASDVVERNEAPPVRPANFDVT